MVIAYLRNQSGTKDMKKILGIEFGSTRIKAVLVDENAKVLASSAIAWENKLLKGNIWSYDLKDAISGMQSAYAALKASYAKSSGEVLSSIDAIGISGMMHGYLPFDANGQQLSPFRTWRCTITNEASVKLTKAFSFPVPQRWSVCHLYQRILDNGKELPKIDFLTTLAGWIHFRLTGERVLGIGEASGVFPIDSETKDYDAKMLKTFERLISRKKLPWTLCDILPKPLPAGTVAGKLTNEGALLLDPTGELNPGTIFAPPEGDVQTGMAATNAVSVGSANISAGTCINAVVILEKRPSRPNPAINLVVSPSGSPAAMCIANTCSSDINAWVKLLGGDYDALFREALKGAPDCGGILTVPYLAGEPVIGMDTGRPLVIRRPDADLSLANFMRANIYSAFTTLRIGLDILLAEGTRLHSVTGHGGLFKTPRVAQQFLADALCTPVMCLATAGEGGAWGMALLASYTLSQQNGRSKTMALENYLARKAFKGIKGETLRPTKSGSEGFASYFKSFKKALPTAKSATSI